ncbi:M56 family metallopeptidase [Pontibacter litorisediminis]|uniref:M56 family metallopeptidase n=1 Tax=Pontibacter litorisediminis TaxID=1846260 RepID=UPI0023EABA5A|nr:M56 family metallopeptidase [Pontibacter litorisediminis]
MPELLLYLLKVNVALVLFYLAYHVALRRLTFYHLNRLFLVFGIVFSTAYPFIDLSALFASEQHGAAAYLVTIPAWAYATPAAAPTQEAFDYWQLPVYAFWAGVSVMLVRFILQFVSLYRIHAASEPAAYKAVPFRKVKSITQAFSFWQTIYLNPAQHKPEELESILRHELIHITGWHTLDVLLAELSIVFYWFNPGAWLMRKAMKENLEFIADQNVVNAGIDRKEYQYLLLKVVGATQPQIANQFNFPSLKRRIAMMNKMPTHKVSRLRLLIVLPLATALLFAFRGAAPAPGATADTEAEALQQNGDLRLPQELVKQLKQNANVKNVRGQRIDSRNALVLTLKGGGTEVYYLDDAKSVAELERKYNLPALPPPPPPAPDAPDAAELPPPPPPVPANEDLPAPPPPARKEAEASVSLPESPVYYIDGEMASDEAVKKLDPKQIHRVDVLKGEAARKEFGSQAANGLVSITTKANKDSQQVKAFSKRLSTASPGTPPPPSQEENVDEAYVFILDEVPYYKEKSNWPADYKAFLERNPSIEKVGWKFNNRREYNLESIVFFLKNGQAETYDYNGKPSIPAAEAKYGQLPQLPPPPPPVKAKE